LFKKQRPILAKRNGTNNLYQASVDQARKEETNKFLRSKRWKTTVLSLSKLGLPPNMVKEVQLKATKQFFFAAAI
jgi:hypothetical protein